MTEPEYLYPTEPGWQEPMREWEKRAVLYRVHVRVYYRNAARIPTPGGSL